MFMTTYRSRKEVPVQEKWNLNDIYPSLPEWEKDFETVKEQAQELKNYDGNINSAKSLLEFLTKQKSFSHV